MPTTMSDPSGLCFAKFIGSNCGKTGDEINAVIGAVTTVAGVACVGVTGGLAAYPCGAIAVAGAAEAVNGLYGAFDEDDDGSGSAGSGASGITRLVTTAAARETPTGLVSDRGSEVLGPPAPGGSVHRSTMVPQRREEPGPGPVRQRFSISASVRASPVGSTIRTVTHQML
jgi:hypothetical protein